MPTQRKEFVRSVAVQSQSLTRDNTVMLAIEIAKFHYALDLSVVFHFYDLGGLTQY